MLFVAFDEVDRFQQSQFNKFSKRITFGFKLIFIVSLSFLIFNVFTVNTLSFANIPSKTFHNKQFWRLFTAPYQVIDGYYGVLSIIISFWWFLSLLVGYEKKYSTIHLLLQVFTQNLLVQFIYSAVVALLIRNTYFYETYNDYFFSLGWNPLIIIWMFKFTGQCKQQKTNFCFLPFPFKNKYLPWIISSLMILLTIQRAPLIIATVLGGVQYHFLYRSILRFPYCFHRILQKPFLLCNRFFTSFVKIDDVEHNLKYLLGLSDDMPESQYSLDKKQSQIEFSATNEEKVEKQRQMN